VTPGPIALVGSGEYLPVMTEVEGELIAGRPPRFVQLATAAAPEGPGSLQHWHELGRAAAERLGVTQVVVPVVDRISADDPELAALVHGAGLVYLSGGNPTFLADTLRGTRVWDAIEQTWQAGAALAGCSAGAMALCGHVSDLRHPLRGAVGLGVVGHLRVLPHFDRFAAHLPDVLLRPVSRAGRDEIVVGIDEDTALVGGPEEWVVRGRASVWELRGGHRVEHPSGSTVRLTASP
jgi:cyanophycinase-like exopeptidase